MESTSKKLHSTRPKYAPIEWNKLNYENILGENTLPSVQPVKKGNKKMKKPDWLLEMRQSDWLRIEQYENENVSRFYQY